MSCLHEMSIYPMPISVGSQGLKTLTGPADGLNILSTLTHWFSSKIHMTVGALGKPLQFQLTAGQAHDITQAEALLLSNPMDYVIADKGYDAETFVQVIRKRGAVPVIPSRSNRKTPREYDAHLYKERHLIECLINKIKQYRRIFSRYDKLATAYLGFLHFVSTLIWLR